MLHSHHSSSAARVALLFAQVPVPIALLRGPTFIYEAFNERYAKHSGNRPLLGLTIQQAFSEIPNIEEFVQKLEKVYQTGVTYEARETQVTLNRGSGHPQKIYLDFTYQAFRGESGEIEGVVVMTSDVTPRVLDKKQVQLERERLENLFFQAPLPICILEGEDHRFVMMNPPYADLVFEGRNLVGKTVREALPELEAQGIFELLTSVYQSGKPYQGIETPFQLSNQEQGVREYYLNFVYQPMLDEQQKVYGIMVIANDVTDQVRARRLSEESEQQLVQMADSMPQIVWTAGPDGVLNYTNQRWVEYSGSNVPSEWGNYVHPDDLNIAYPTWMHSVATGANYETEFRIRRIDGVYQWHLVRAIAARDDEGRIYKWHGTCTNIEDQKAVQNELINAEKELLTAKNQAETANQLKTAFLANMSHEIRTPLGAILGFTEILKNGGYDQNERNRYLDVVSKNGKALTRIIDDILDLSKVEAGRLEVETVAFSLPVLLNETVALFSDTVKEKGVGFVLEQTATAPDWVISDPTRLRQILINVIGNAVKFTSRGQIHVKVGSEKGDSNSRVWIEVADSGVGLNDEQVRRLFQPFNQADNSTTRKFGGTGLGLALSKRLAAALSGDITLTRHRAGEGCTFLIEIGVELPTEKRSEPGHSESGDLKNSLDVSGLNVLVVDDSPDNLDLLEIYLSQRGVTVEVAASGEEAILKATSAKFDVILMDIQMPGIDGHQAVKTLRANGYQRPVIALTAHAMNEERDRAIASGFNDHVSKPIHFETLLKAILKQTSLESIRL